MSKSFEELMNDPQRIMDECKHCGLAIVSESGRPHTFRHAEGPQRQLNRCALRTYGYDAEPAGIPCSHACLGSSTGIDGRVPQ